MVGVDVEPGGEHPFHLHPEMGELISILAGSAEQWIERDKKILQAGELAFVPKKMVNATFNAGDELLSFFAKLGPATDLKRSVVYIDQEEPWKSLDANK